MIIKRANQSSKQLIKIGHHKNPAKSYTKLLSSCLDGKQERRTNECYSKKKIRDKHQNIKSQVLS